MKRSKRWVTLAALTAPLVAVAGVAWAIGLTVSSKSLGAATLSTPALYPSSLAAANVNKGTVGRLEKGDTLTVVYNGVIQNSSICAGAPQGSSSGAGFTFTLSNGGAGNDTLAISGGTSCPVLHLGNFLLGSPSYLTTGSISYTNSTVAVVPGATTTTITLTVGTGTASATVSGATVVRYFPDAAITDTSARSIGTNTTSTTSAVQF